MGNQIFDSANIKSINSVAQIRSLSKMRFTSLSRNSIINMQQQHDELAKSRGLDRPTFKPTEFKSHLSDHYSHRRSPSKDLERVDLISGKYRVLNVLGKGQFGTVLRVEDVTGNEFYALKCFNMDLKNDENESFKTEIQILKILDNEHVVSYHDSFTLSTDPLKSISPDDGREGKFLCLAMEYVQGGSMDDLLKFGERARVHLPGDICILWFVTLLEVLDYCHSQGICHRDLKPDNILLHYHSLEGDMHEMKMCLTDFGVGKAVAKGEKVKLDDTNVGHLFYAPLEALLEEPHDFRYDVYSLGVVFFQMYFGLSTSSYQKAIFDLVPVVKNDPKLKDKFEEDVLDEDDDYDPCDFMVFLHSNGLYKTRFVDKFAKKDPAIAVIIGLMVCDLKQRKTMKEIRDHPIVKTWSFIFDAKKGKNVKVPQWIDFDAVVTFFKLITKDEDQIHLFSTLLDVMLQGLDIKKVRESICEFLLKKKGFDVLFNKFLLVDNLCTVEVEDDIDEGSFNKREFEILSKMLCVFDKSFEIMESHVLQQELIHFASVKCREFCLLDVISRYLICDGSVSGRVSILKFLQSVTKVNSSVCVYLGAFLFPMIKEYFSQTDEIQILLLNIISIMLPYSTFTEFPKFYYSLKLSSLKEKMPFLKMFSLVKWECCTVHLLSVLIQDIIVPKIEELHSSKQIEELKKFLETLFSVNIDSKPKIESQNTVWQNINLEENDKSSENDLFFLNESDDVSDDYISLESDCFVVRCKHDLKREKNEALVISSELLCVIQNNNRQKKEETMLGYYEFKVLDGGCSDLFQFGIILNYKEAYYVEPFEENEFFLYKSNLDGYSELDIIVDETLKKNRREKDKIWIKSCEELCKQMHENLDVESMEFLNEEGDWVEISDEEMPTSQHFLLRIKENDLEENEIEEFAPFKKILCMTGDTIGCGVTSKGNLMITKNGAIFSVNKIPSLLQGDKVRVSSFFKFSQNDFFAMAASFETFLFDFENIRNPMIPIPISEKDRKKLEIKLSKVCKKPNVSLVNICDKIKREIKSRSLSKKSTVKKKVSKK